MKAIMISIQPQWVEKILNGEKTIEIRKTMPKCELPCKVYIYETKGKKHFYNYIEACECPSEEERIKFWEYGCGKVVAEFTLNKITKHEKNFIDCEDNICYNFYDEDVKNSGFGIDIFDLVDFDNFVEDYGKGKPLYAWYIDNLKIYDKPKELSEFVLPNKKNCKTCFLYRDMCNEVCEENKQHLFRPPQSWCYVEKVEG